MRLLRGCIALCIVQLATGFSPAAAPLLREPRSVSSRRACLEMHAQGAPPLAALTRRSALGLLLAAPAAALAQPLVKTEVAPTDTPCDQAISRLVNKQTGQEMYIIGTAHISQLSADLVRETIRSVKPDTVMIELDEKRVRRGVASADKAAKEKPRSVWQLLRDEFGRPDVSFGDKVRNFESGLIGLVIGGLYEKLNKGLWARCTINKSGPALSGAMGEMGFSSGQEFVVAIEEAKALNATLVLGDRSVDATLSRLQETINKSGFKAVQGFAQAQSASPSAAVLASELEADGEDMAAIAKTVESLKERSTVRELMATLKASLPEVYTALISERDVYMAGSLLSANGKSSVAVVGMAHMDGIEKALGEAGFEVSTLCPI